MLFAILAIVVLSAMLIPFLLSMDQKYTHKKCKNCGKSIKVEDAKCRHCKMVLVNFPDDQTDDDAK